jgi:hypothetical protein
VATVILPLSSPARLDELATLTLQTTFGGGIGGDNWTSTRSRSRRGVDLHQSAGGPWFASTATTARSSPLRGARCRRFHRDFVLLEHVNTGALLHSHPHPMPEARASNR